MIEVNTIDKRLLELKQTLQMRGKLTREQTQEFNKLAQIKQEAANHPSLVQARAEAARRQAELEQRNAAARTERAFETIFSTVVPGKPPMQAIDNEANRREILSWLHPDEHVSDPRAWFLRVLQETPSLKTRLAWTPHLTPAEMVLQQKDDQKRLREQFDLACKTHGLVPNEANYSVWVSVPNPLISVFNGQPVIILESGDTLELVPASQEMKDQWAEDARNQRFQAHQDRLRQMRDSNDLEGLRAAAKAEREERYNPQAVANAQQQKLYAQLRNQYAKDSQAGYWEPLPSHLTKKVIYSWNTADMRKYMSRYGASRVSARMNDITTIPDGNGGTINFEEKQNAANTTY